MHSWHFKCPFKQVHHGGGRYYDFYRFITTEVDFHLFYDSWFNQRLNADWGRQWLSVIITSIRFGSDCPGVQIPAPPLDLGSYFTSLILIAFLFKLEIRKRIFGGFDGVMNVKFLVRYLEPFS